MCDETWLVGTNAFPALNNATKNEDPKIPSGFDIPISETVIPSNPCEGGDESVVIPFWFPRYSAIAAIPESAPAIANETIIFNFVLYPAALADELLNPVAFSLKPILVNLNNAQIITAAIIDKNIAVLTPEFGKIFDSQSDMKFEPA